MNNHIHLSLIHAWITFLEVILILIPVKLIAARFEGKSALASGILHVL